MATEGEVLVATIRYLFRNGATPTQISVAVGKGINSVEVKERVKRIFREESKKSVKPEFRPSGPDIVAASEDVYWQVECKGFGTGKPPTHRNNFDRALASVVSYYKDPPPEDAKYKKGAKAALGLALPASEQYRDLLKTRLGKPLRKRLNLWVLLYDRKRRQINPIRPNDEYP